MSSLLVLMDGRTLYTPLFSGVFWEEADTVLEDLDRIEVIRGPGATLWGANAVNGVINIITKSARETQGILIAGGGGIEEEGFGAVRCGAKLADGLYFRVHGKYVKRDDFTLDDGSRANDWLWSGQGGFRLDWEASDANTVTFQGDYYDMGRHVEWGAGLRYVDGLAHWEIPGYTEFETRLAWKPTQRCELAVVGRNLSHAHHREFAPLIIGVRNVEVDRAVFGKITLNF